MAVCIAGLLGLFLCGQITDAATSHLTLFAARCAYVAFPQPSGALSLEVYAERAGVALDCAYSNSAEFDAALIGARRAAGVYGPRRHCRQMLATAVGFAAGLVVVAFLIV